MILIDSLHLDYFHPSSQGAFYEALDSRRLKRPAELNELDGIDFHIVYNPVPNEVSLDTIEDWSLNRVTGYGIVKMSGFTRERMTMIKGYSLTGLISPYTEPNDEQEVTLYVNNGVALITDDMMFSSELGTHNLIQGVVTPRDAITA